MGVVALTATPFSCRMRVNKDEWICRNRRFHACREERGRHVYWKRDCLRAICREKLYKGIAIDSEQDSLTNGIGWPPYGFIK